MVIGNKIELVGYINNDKVGDVEKQKSTLSYTFIIYIILPFKFWRKKSNYNYIKNALSSPFNFFV